MKVFISWSGERSKQVAKALREWIPDVLQAVEPWMSEMDIEAGARWNRVIQDKLNDIRFGIVCITRDNCNAPWILFEAGALAKTLEDTFVCPYLIDLRLHDLPQGPLTQFQAKEADEEGTWALIQTVNTTLGEEALSEDKLRKTFERWWPDLKSALHELPELEDKDKVKRPVDEMIEEILILVRGFAQRPTEIRGWPIALEKMEGEWEQPFIFLIDWPSARSPRGLAGQRLGPLISEFTSRLKEIERERLKSGQSKMNGEASQSTSSDQKTNEE